MFLEIVTPEASIFQGEVETVTVPGVVGQFQILNNHAPIVSLLQEGKIKITLQQTDQDQIELIYADTGIGIPEDFDWENSKSLGMSLIKLLSEKQLNQVMVWRGCGGLGHSLFLSLASA